MTLKFENFEHICSNDAVSDSDNEKEDHPDDTNQDNSVEDAIEKG